jgi:hypothetical protein
MDFTFEIENGLLGVNRDTFLLLIKSMYFKDDKMVKSVWIDLVEHGF